MKLLPILNDPPYGSERGCNGLRMAPRRSRCPSAAPSPLPVIESSRPAPRSDLVLRL